MRRESETDGEKTGRRVDWIQTVPVDIDFAVTVLTRCQAVPAALPAWHFLLLNY